jgi:hypothetical protein
LGAIVTVLSNIVGYAAANFNMAPWPSAFATASDFTDTQWTKTGSSITTGVVSPSGATDAQKIVESSGSGNHLVISANAPILNGRSPVIYRMAVIAQAAERSRIVAYWQNWNGSFVEVEAAVGFDLAGGNVGYDTTVGTNATLVDYNMTSLGNGWWLCIMDAQYNLAYDGSGDVWEPQIALDAGTGTAARNVSYTGNGTSGVNIWWCGLLPKSAWNLNRQSFFDDFNDLSTIDLNDTRAPGFKWYVHNLFPNSYMTTFGWTTNPPSAPTPAANLSISSPSVLKIYNPNNNQIGYQSQIWSVATDGSNGYVGTTFSPPMVFDGYFNWNGSDVSPNWGGNPAFWGASIEALTGTPSSGRFLEWDVTEATPNGSSTKHDWSNPSSPVDHHSGINNMYSMVAGTFMRISGIWVPSTDSDGNGWGFFLSFVDGQYFPRSDIYYSASAVPIPPVGPSGTFSEADSQHMPIFLNTAENVTANPGGGWPMYIDWVKVHTAGSNILPSFRHSKIGTRSGSRQMAQ